jgi:hypothetical protein
MLLEGLTRDTLTAVTDAQRRALGDATPEGTRPGPSEWTNPDVEELRRLLDELDPSENLRLWCRGALNLVNTLSVSGGSPDSWQEALAHINPGGAGPDQELCRSRFLSRPDRDQRRVRDRGSRLGRSSTASAAGGP